MSKKGEDLKPIFIRLSKECHDLLEYMKYYYSKQGKSMHKSQIVRQLCEENLPGIVMKLKADEAFEERDPVAYKAEQMRKRIEWLKEEQRRGGKQV